MQICSTAYCYPKQNQKILLNYITVHTTESTKNLCCRARQCSDVTGFPRTDSSPPTPRHSHGLNSSHRKVSYWETPKDGLCLPSLLGCCPSGRSASAWRWKLSCSSPPACLASGISLSTSNSYPLNPSSLWSVARHLHAWIQLEK